MIIVIKYFWTNIEQATDTVLTKFG